MGNFVNQWQKMQAMSQRHSRHKKGKTSLGSKEHAWLILKTKRSIGTLKKRYRMRRGDDFDDSDDSSDSDEDKKGKGKKNAEKDQDKKKEDEEAKRRADEEAKRRVYEEAKEKESEEAKAKEREVAKEREKLREEIRRRQKLREEVKEKQKANMQALEHVDVNKVLNVFLKGYRIEFKKLIDPSMYRTALEFILLIRLN